MIGLVLVTHGRLGDEMLNTLQHVCGIQEKTRTVPIGPDDDMERRREDVFEAVRAVNSGKGVVVVTDMFGGTPCNLALSIIDRAKAEARAEVDVLAGANLPMLVKLASVRKALPLDEAIAEAREAGRKYIIVASGTLRSAETAA